MWERGGGGGGGGGEEEECGDGLLCRQIFCNKLWRRRHGERRALRHDRRGWGGEKDGRTAGAIRQARVEAVAVSEASRKRLRGVSEASRKRLGGVSEVSRRCLGGVAPGVQHPLVDFALAERDGDFAALRHGAAGSALVGSEARKAEGAGQREAAAAAAGRRAGRGYHEAADGEGEEILRRASVLAHGPTSVAVRFRSAG